MTAIIDTLDMGGKLVYLQENYTIRKLVVCYLFICNGEDELDRH